MLVSFFSRIRLIIALVSFDKTKFSHSLYSSECEKDVIGFAVAFSSEPSNSAYGQTTKLPRTLWANIELSGERISQRDGYKSIYICIYMLRTSKEMTKTQTHAYTERRKLARMAQRYERNAICMKTESSYCILILMFAACGTELFPSWVVLAMNDDGGGSLAIGVCMHSTFGHLYWPWFVYVYRQLSAVFSDSQKYND